jgi:hypothetical protein
MIMFYRALTFQSRPFKQGFYDVFLLTGCQNTKKQVQHGDFKTEV